MKPTQVTELFANIKKTFVSFFSILMFVALGVGIFLGISWAGPALKVAANQNFNEGSFHHYQIQYPYGLTDDDIREIAKYDGVTQVEGVRQSFQTAEYNGKTITLSVQSKGERINTLRVIDGSLPEKANEIALNANDASELGLSVGDIIVFNSDDTDDSDSSTSGSDWSSGNAEESSSGEKDTDGMTYLNGATYKVTALVDSPEYLALSKKTYGSTGKGSGTIDIVSWVSPEAFDGSAFKDAYPVVNVRCNAMDGLDTFSDSYKQVSQDYSLGLADLCKRLADNRYRDIYASVKADVDEADKKLTSAKNEVVSKEKELEDARSQLASAEADLNSAYSQLVAGRNQLDDNWGEYNASAVELQEKQSQFDEALVQAQQAIDVQAVQAGEMAVLELLSVNPSATQEEQDAVRAAAVARVYESINIDDLPAGDTGMTIGQTRQALTSAQAELDDVLVWLNQGEAELQSGWVEYYENQAKLEDIRNSITEGEQKIQEAKKEIADNETKLGEVKSELDDIKPYEVSISGRKYNPGAAQVTMFSNVTDRLSWSMAGLFIIVGMLVSYSAVSRIVYEQAVQIGTKKALGFRGREITLSYLLYSALAVIAGAVIGTIVGVIAVEGIIGHVLGSMFILGDYPPFFGLPLFLAVTALELILILGTTWFACHFILREHAIQLLSGANSREVKTRFFENWAIWDKLSLLTQTIINNCINDKRRVFSTLVGVAGCTALIVTAITLNDDVMKSFDYQYESVYSFNDIVYVDDDVDNAASNIEKALSGNVNSTAQVISQRLIVDQPDGDSGSIRMIVPDNPESFAQCYHVNLLSNDQFDLQAEGVWVSQAYADHFDVKVGDDLTVETGDGTKRKLQILGFYEYWLTNYEVVIGRDYYEKMFDTHYVPNAILVNSGDMVVEDVAALVDSIDGFDSIVDDKASENEVFTTFSSVSRTVVAIYLVLSVLMAIVILLNLNVMFVAEKKRELIVLMVNGFSNNQAKSYIYTDSILLTLIGVVLGVILGCIMGVVTVGSVEPVTATLLKTIDPIAVVAGVLGSFALAIIMNIIALRRIDNFILTEIN